MQISKRRGVRSSGILTKKEKNLLWYLFLIFYLLFYFPYFRDKEHHLLVHYTKSFLKCEIWLEPEARNPSRTATRVAGTQWPESWLLPLRICIRGNQNQKPRTWSWKFGTPIWDVGVLTSRINIHLLRFFLSLNISNLYKQNKCYVLHT